MNIPNPRRLRALAAALGLALAPAAVSAQKALVYCPVGIDETGCNTIVAALNSVFTGGIDRAYDGSSGTVDLATVDLAQYSVLVIPSLADDNVAQPYARLRDPAIAARVRAALLGRVALWSGTPDQGSTNRADKDILIRNLASWAGANFAAVNGPGLIALQDHSATTSARYNWVSGLTGFSLTADAALQVYSSVRTLTPLGTQLLSNGGTQLAYSNMASLGFQLPSGAAGVSLDGVGQTGSNTGGQVVLITSAGSSAGATIWTDKDDYAPGQVVAITGTGFQAGETVSILLHEDPLVHTDRTFTSTADSTGGFVNSQFSPEVHHIGVRFVVTATGQTSGRSAQTTFTDGNLQTVTLTPDSIAVVQGDSALYATLVEMGGNSNPCTITLSVTTALPAGAVATFIGGSNPTTITNDDISRTLKITTTAATPPGTYSFTVQAAEGSNCNSPGGTTTAMGKLVVTTANAAPVSVDDAYSTNEDTPLVVAAPGVLTNDTDANGNSLTATRPAGSTGPGNGTLTLNADGSFTYTPNADFNGTDTFTYKAHDGTVASAAFATVTITVNAVNDAPSFVEGGDETVDEDAGAQTVANWAIAISAGPSNESGQTLTFTTSNDDNTLFSVQPSVAANGTLTYTPAPDAFGWATVTVTLQDSGGTANGGVDTFVQTFTITVNPVNDAPSFLKGADQTVAEDAGVQSVPGWATSISVGPANESTQTVSFIVTNNTNPGLFSAGPAVAADGTLTYTPAANAFGSATITLKAKDDGGTANGGVDESATQSFLITVTSVNDPPTFTLIAGHTSNEDAGAQSVPSALTAASPGPANEPQALTLTISNDNNALFSVQPDIDLSTGVLTYTAAPNAFGTANVTVRLTDTETAFAEDALVITVNAVNDAPSFTKGADQTVLEDSGPASVSGWATGISSGPANESGQTVNFIITGNTNPGLFSAGPAVSSSGTLAYTPAANANGTATITLKAKDDGGIANSGVDESATQSFVIDVSPVNDAPSFTKGPNQTVLEDAAAQTVANWATSISAGPADEAGQTLTFSTTNTDNTLFSVQPAVALDGTLTYTPAANAFGSATVTVKLMDNGGTANGGVDFTEQTFTITITPVNDAPSFTKGADQTVLEDSGPATISPWATAINAGPFETQTVSFDIVGNTNPGLFSAAPAVASDGTLTFTPALNANGSATIEVRIRDDGGTANGGQDTSAVQSFVINVTPVNDAPTYELIGNQTVAEDAGAQTVANAVTSQSPGPSNESGQTLTLSVSSTNPGLFSSAPAIDASGTLTYTPATNANGSSTVTVTLKDNGGTTNGGVDQTVKTFTITVTPVNDDPVITALTAGPSPAQVNTTTTLSATFTDVDLGDVPNLETHTASINWGDGTPATAGTISGSTGTSRSVAGSHIYTGPGVYTVTLTVRDGSNATDVEIFQYVVIYDPSAGFVTGGGWINSPAGAYVASPTLTAKANFGFVAKYKKGATAPEGNTEFQFHAGDLNFHSTTYQYLVVAGAKGIFKGEGKVNGALGFGFLISAVDGQLNGGGGTDKFRIKIWRLSDESIVYDNLPNAGDDATPTTILGGGSIVIHAK